MNILVKHSEMYILPDILKKSSIALKKFDQIRVSNYKLLTYKLSNKTFTV